MDKVYIQFAKVLDANESFELRQLVVYFLFVFPPIIPVLPSGDQTFDTVAYISIAPLLPKAVNSIKFDNENT